MPTARMIQRTRFTIPKIKPENAAGALVKGAETVEHSDRSAGRRSPAGGRAECAVGRGAEDRGPDDKVAPRRPAVPAADMETQRPMATANAVPITVARGDGIGPEIMAATLQILHEAGARLAIEEIEIGEKVYLAGNTSGIAPEAWESLRRTKVFLKAPITTPQGGGFKSLNVTTRKTLGLYANVRPCVSYHPFVATKHPGWTS